MPFAREFLPGPDVGENLAKVGDVLARTGDVGCWIVVISDCPGRRRRRRRWRYLDDIIKQKGSVQLAEEVERVVISEFEK